MSKTVDTDIMVCGLGPAGAIAAATAAKAGLKVLAVERNAKAGLPVQCAEYVPMMIGSELPSVRDAKVQNIERMLTHIGSNAAEETPDFNGIMINRDRLDADLVGKAIAAGVQCRFATPVRSVSASGVVRLADETVVRAKVIIGADGPRSVVGKAIGCVNNDLVETRQMTVDLLAPHNGTDIYLNADFIGGYGWLFPKGELCNLGLGVIAKQRRSLKPALSGLHALLLEEGRVGSDIHAVTGGAIPVGGIVGPAGALGGRQLLLCGDAAGLTNPVTGAGINAAVISGALAGEYAAAIVDGDENAAEDYAEEIEATFARSLALAIKRRRQLLDSYKGNGRPREAQLRKGWIAYPQYWSDDSAPVESNANEAARMTA